VERDEQNLVKRCLARDQDACALLVDTYARMVGTVIWRATGDQNCVDDLAQETFMRVFRALPYFDSRARLSTWIYTIAHRLSIDHLRKVGRWKEEALTADDDFWLPQEPSIDPESRVAQNEVDALVRSGLERIPEQYRIPLVYSAIEGLDYPTIATMLGVPLGTVKTLVFRGKRMLKEEIGKVLK
jgi:RNA polymerase sigma-70 factor (ECF subfamily)